LSIQRTPTTVCGRRQDLWHGCCGGPQQGLPLRGDQVRTFVCTRGTYYCGVGAGKVYGRDVVEAHIGPASTRGSGRSIFMYSGPLQLWCGHRQGLRQGRCGGPLQGLSLRRDQVGTYVCTQGPNYCRVSGGKVYGRRVVYTHLWACLYAGIRWEHLSVLRPLQQQCGRWQGLWQRRCGGPLLDLPLAGIRWEHLFVLRAPSKVL
jgi:hypothetical protein